MNKRHKQEGEAIADLISRIEFAGKSLDLSSSYISLLIGGSSTLYKRLVTGGDIQLRTFEKALHNINKLMEEYNVMYEVRK